MYIRVCAKHARVHSFNANCTSWGGGSAGGAGFVPVLPAPSFTPAMAVRAGSCPLGSARAGGRSPLPPAPFPGRSRNGARGGSEAPGRAARLRCFAPRTCACSSTAAPTFWLHRDVSVWSTHSFGLWFFITFYYFAKKKILTLGDARAMPRFNPPHLADSSIAAFPKTSRVPVTLHVSTTLFWVPLV